VAEEKKSLFERYVPVVVPAATLIATLFLQHQRPVALGLVALAFIALALSAFPWILRKVREHRASTYEREVVKDAMAEVGRYVRKFVELTDIQTNDSIDAVVFGNLCGRNDANYNTLHVIEPIVFDELCEQLNSRVLERGASYEELRATVEELTYLVNTFCRYLIGPIYEQVPTRLTPGVLALYTPQIGGELIQYRERFTAFRDSYADFLKELEVKLPRPLGLGFYVAGPKPLKSLTGGKTIAQL
jgi:hypothetical protein